MDRIKIYNTKDERYSVLAEEIYVDSYRRKGIGETPQCASTRRLNSRPKVREV
ncbi:hypothetical protein GCM10007063_28960 [Lentibacillus kapialis]|uniref:Uncharacterized protein n=1 Tax=Lentibacillus kapialis TaxID=340214 RepID=A0A917Q140_9BACI|nr:hypothetical protein GCM10007063_28960 [Lentibacillus kapialis]